MRSVVLSGVGLLALLTCRVVAQEEAAAAKSTPAAAPAAAVNAAPATAEEAIARIETLLNEEDEDAPQSEEQVVEYWKKRLPKVDALLADFRKRFAADPLRWKAMFLEASAREIREELELPIPKDSRPVVDIYAEIMAASDADAETKADASSARLLSLADDVSDKKLQIAEWEKQLATHLKSFPEYPENTMLVEMRLVLVEEVASGRLVALLEELSRSADTNIAALAQGRLASAKTMAELKSKPLDLKFKAFDGNEVDLANLRGKVVLVDFWATWCGPCMIEVPDLVRTYGRLKEKGFEIIGISLDEDQSELKRVLKAKQITWPQYFDGAGWENPYVKKFGIDGIPTKWLVNKKGMVVETNVEEDLEGRIEKLLAE